MPKKNHKNYPLDQSPFYCLKSKKKLAQLLGVSFKKLGRLIKSEELYRERSHSDKNGKLRLLEIPRSELMWIQKRIQQLLGRVKVLDNIHCPAKGRSYITNAQSHVGSAVVWGIDVKKYFPSTPSRRVYWFFNKRMECSSDVAHFLTKLTTFKERLPTGSPSSPILSYFAHIDMWEEISKIAEEEKLILTVIMDDLTISATNITGKAMWKIKQEIHRCGLRYHKERFYAGRNPRLITGIYIDGNKLKLPNRQHLKMYKLRQLIKKETNLAKKAKLLQRLNGLKSQAQQIEKINSKQLLNSSF